MNTRHLTIFRMPALLLALLLCCERRLPTQVHEQVRVQPMLSIAAGIAVSDIDSLIMVVDINNTFYKTWHWDWATHYNASSSEFSDSVKVPDLSKNIRLTAILVGKTGAKLAIDSGYCDEVDAFFGSPIPIRIQLSPVNSLPQVRAVDATGSDVQTLILTPNDSVKVTWDVSDGSFPCSDTVVRARYCHDALIMRECHVPGLMPSDSFAPWIAGTVPLSPSSIGTYTYAVRVVDNDSNVAIDSVRVTVVKGGLQAVRGDVQPNALLRQLDTSGIYYFSYNGTTTLSLAGGVTDSMFHSLWVKSRWRVVNASGTEEVATDSVVGNATVLFPPSGVTAGTHRCIFVGWDDDGNTRSDTLTFVMPDTFTNTRDASRRMVLVPGGFFTYLRDHGTGTASTDTAFVTRGFFIDTAEVTQTEFFSVMGFNPAVYKTSIDRPVDSVTWYDAILFCNKLSKNAILDTAYTYRNPVFVGNTCTGMTQPACNFAKSGYRLPTMDEWELAARAGSRTPNWYYWGNDTAEATIKANCWYQANAGGRNGWTTPHAVLMGSQPVATLAANAYGVFDMLGNISEWCWGENIIEHEDFGSNIHSHMDLYPAFDVTRIHARGGNWWSSDTDLQLPGGDFNVSRIPSQAGNTTGFRIVRSAP